MTTPTASPRPTIDVDVLLWWRAVDLIARHDDTPDRPSIQHITLVAHHRGMYADYAGTECRPAQSTLAERAQIERESVRRVDAWLVGAGLLKFVRNGPRGLKVYRLTIPADGRERRHLSGLELPTPDGGPDGHLPADDGAATHLNPSQMDAEPATWNPDEGQMAAQPATTYDLENSLLPSAVTHTAPGERDDGIKIDQVLDELVRITEARQPRPPAKPQRWRITVRRDLQRRHAADIVGLVARHRADTPANLLAARLLGEPAATLRHYECHPAA